MDTASPDKDSRTEGSLLVLWKNQVSAQKVIHALIGGKHIDPCLSEEFRFLENHSSAWEEFFQWLGYRLRQSELGGTPFFYLEANSDMANLARLSRGATFLGLYLSWHFFMLGPGEPDRIPAEEVFRKLVSSYSFTLLRSVFVRRGVGVSQVELSEDQAEKLRGHIRRELSELARYRFIDVKPHVRASWEDLVVHRLPGLYRFWELALHIRGTGVGEKEFDIDQMVAQVWGQVEIDPEEGEP